FSLSSFWVLTVRVTVPAAIVEVNLQVDLKPANVDPPWVEEISHTRLQKVAPPVGKLGLLPSGEGLEVLVRVGETSVADRVIGAAVYSAAKVAMTPEAALIRIS